MGLVIKPNPKIMSALINFQNAEQEKYPHKEGGIFVFYPFVCGRRGVVFHELFTVFCRLP
jgi:hypothetical protein